MSASIKRRTSVSTGKKAKRAPSKDAKAGSQRKKGAETQALKEDTAAGLAVRVADRERRGDLRKGPDESEIATEDLLAKDCLDSEVSTDDEDESNLPDLDEGVETWERVVAAFHPGGSFYSEDPVEISPDPIELRVDEDGSCRLLRPAWMAGETVTEEGEEDFERIELRFQMFDLIAKWLTLERVKFLKTPNPLHLGVKALEEMQLGQPSVSPQGFLDLTGISKLVAGELKIEEKSVESDFSRYCTGCSLVWNDGSRLPLKFLFSSEARNAWVACAVKQFFASIGQPLQEDGQISKLRGLTIPKSSKDKDELARSSFQSLSQPEFIARANQMAGTRWEEVMDSHLQLSKSS